MRNWLLVLSVALIAAGCGGAKVDGRVAAKRSRGNEDGKGILGEVGGGTRCQLGDGRREVLVDLDQDDDPDVRKVYQAVGDTEVVICREADLNFDGIKDLFVFFDETGQTTRDEVDLDYDGSIDIISTYAAGKAVKQEIDTNSDGLVDRVRFLDNDLPVRLEADTDGDRKVDYWEYYEAGKLIRIGIDKDGDGRADNWSRDDETEAAIMEEAAGSEEEPADDAESKEEGGEGADSEG